jgi:predicted phage terminase large subunit-like protein
MSTVRGHGPKRGMFRGAMDGARIWWVAPNYPIADRIIWPDLKRALSNAWSDKSESDHYIQLPGGGSVTVKSADNPDSLRGAGLDGVVMDEAAFTERRVWSEVIRPMLADRNGWAMFLTSPNGCNWFYDLFHSAAASDWQRWQRPTSDNPLIGPSELAAARRDVGPRIYAQEFEAKFTEEDGATFPVEYFPDSIWFDQWPSGNDTVFRCLGVDPSLGRSELSDFSGIASVLLHKDGTFYAACDLDRRPPNQILQDAIGIYRQFPAQAIGIEAVAFQSMLLDEFRRLTRGQDVHPFGLTDPLPKKQRIMRLDPLLAQGRLKFLRGHRGTELLVEQLRGFPLKKYHDDGPDALEMAIRLCSGIVSGNVRLDQAYEEQAVA